VKIPKPISSLIESFEKLPGIGPKTAQRLTYYLLHVPQSELDDFAVALSNLKKDTVLCSVCKNVAESNPCPICIDPNRDKSVILVVEQPLDILAFEKTGKYHGLYHVLHGAIDPLNNIGPDELFINDLMNRVKGQEGERVKEIIIATNPTMEGEATAMYLTKKVKEQEARLQTPKRSDNGQGERVKITRLGMGVPTGADLEYADEVTLNHALEGRREL
jgi:recombination protein RecR